MVTRLEDLALSRVSRSAKLEIVKSFSGSDHPEGERASGIDTEEALVEMSLVLREMAAELSGISQQTRTIAREEIELSRAALLEDARAVARREAVLASSAVAPTGSEDVGPPALSWSMVLVALCVSALMGLAATLAGWAGAAAVATMILVWSTVSVARS
jgi:hypothetical protein